jgi:alanyl-tRNA synthetase
LIEETLKLEETRFKQTLDRGLRLLDDELAGLEQDAPLSGQAAFKLYDTYGFPLDLTQDALREKGREVDTDGFDAAMAEQKAKARAAWAGSGDAADATIWFDIADQNGATDFLGYDTEKAEGQVVALVRNGELIEKADEGEDVQVVLNQTPFYAESGGQIGDSGVIRIDDSIIEVSDTKKASDVFIHIGRVLEGQIAKGDPAVLEVDHARRTAIRANHSATHLLHEALRRHLGDHVAQKGSLNADDRLRFDFSHSKALSEDELARVEAEVNDFIRQNTPVETRIMTPDDARDIGAQALFGEKYGDEVRVVSMGFDAQSGKGGNGSTYSIELCGGTHVRQTGDIGLCVLLGDSASSAGVRRIEALTGAGAQTYLAQQVSRLGDVAGMLKAQPADVPERVKSLLEERKAMNAEIAKLRKDLAMAGQGSGTGPQTEDVNGVSFLAQVLTGVSGKELPGLIDEHKSRLQSGAVLLIADADGKVAVAAGVTDDLKSSLSAVDLVKAAVTTLGGKGGGGRSDMAQGGAKSAENADEAIAAAKAVIGG